MSYGTIKGIYATYHTQLLEDLQDFDLNVKPILSPALSPTERNKLDLRLEETPEGNIVLYAYTPDKEFGMVGNPILGITPSDGRVWLTTSNATLLKSMGLKVDPKTQAIEVYILSGR